IAEDNSLDSVGVGKLAKAIPQKAWLAVVETACETFRSCIAPITKTTSGIGRLIDAKFDRLVDAEKILAADVMSRATEKAHAAKHTKPETTPAETTKSRERHPQKGRKSSVHESDVQERPESTQKT